MKNTDVASKHLRQIPSPKLVKESQTTDEYNGKQFAVITTECLTQQKGEEYNI